jgi:predicted lipoprotein with Yx(FWY)xxD motif
MVKLGFVPVAVLAAGAFAACGSSDSTGKDGPVVSSEDAAALTAAKTAKSNGPKLKITQSDYGRILANGRGRALYLFTADKGKKSNCAGACAGAWPPYTVKAKPSAGPGAKRGKIGTTQRADGRLQATYAGHPLYYYVGDDEPGEVLCQAVNEFGGYWYVVRPNGKAVR